jgi:YgiT-type zinc finger domain-containing protein
MEQPDTAKCPACRKGHLMRKVKQVRARYRARSISYSQPGDWCNHCANGVLSADDVLATQGILAKWRQTIDQNKA